MINRISLFLLSATLLFSCHKKAVHKNHQEMIGSWYHAESPNKNRWYIAIGENSWGTVTVYDSTGRDLEYNGENGRRWRYNEKTNRLYNGIISPIFIVNQLPAIASSQIVSGYDTIEVGETYCIINSGYYRKTE